MTPPRMIPVSKFATLRKLTLTLLTGCVALCLILPAQAAAQTRRALLVGINTYQPEEAQAAKPATELVEDKPSARGKTRGTWTNLDGSLNDVEAMRELLIARYGFKAEHVRVLTQAAATREGIMKAFQEHLVAPAAKGDISFFFYAGHGSQVRNSKATEADQLDETIVPSDSFRGAPDIRDKELARLFHKALDRGVVFTAVLDSCHSGSVSRGLPRRERSRNLPPDPNEVADPPDPGPTPRERGALVLSAAQDHQTAAEQADDQGIDHGLFSASLMKVLRNAPMNEPAERIFRRVKAIMQSDGRTQEPVLEGMPARVQGPLFGAASEGLSGATTVAVLKVEDDGGISLQGGYALGLSENTTLRKFGGKDEKAAPRLRVTKVEGLSRARAEFVGAAEEVKPGDLFEVEEFVAPAGANLRVWMPPAGPSLAELIAATKELGALRQSDRIAWVDDPTQDTPTHVLAWQGAGWTLAQPDGSSRTRGGPLTAAALLDQLPAGAAKPKLYVHIPPAAELREAIKLGAGTANSAIEIAAKPENAQYVLAGRATETGFEYAWILPNASRGDNDFPLPVRTDWVALGDAASAASAARRLEGFTQRIGRLRAWLQLEAPPEDGRFPYRLAFKNAKTGEVLTAGTLNEGESYVTVLQADEKKLTSKVDRRYVYVFAIDSYGKSVLIFPLSGAGSVENRVPIERDENGKPPKEVALGEAFGIGPPFGIDTYVVLSTEQAIDPSVLESEGVRTRGAGAPGKLAQLLSGVGSATRGPRPATPSDWSIERLLLRSAPSSK